MREDLKKENLIVRLTFGFAVEVVGFCAKLDEMKKWSLSNQLLRAALSIGANVKEAQNAESKADFTHKMKIAAKEAEEAEFYLEVCQAAPELPSDESLTEKVRTLSKVLNKIISTSKKGSGLMNPAIS